MVRFVDIVSQNEMVSNVRIDRLFQLRKLDQTSTTEPLSAFTFEYFEEERRISAIRFMRRNKQEQKGKQV